MVHRGGGQLVVAYGCIAGAAIRLLYIIEYISSRFLAASDYGRLQSADISLGTVVARRMDAYEPLSRRHTEVVLPFAHHHRSHPSHWTLLLLDRVASTQLFERSGSVVRT